MRTQNSRTAPVSFEEAKPRDAENEKDSRWTLDKLAVAANRPFAEGARWLADRLGVVSSMVAAVGLTSSSILELTVLYDGKPGILAAQAAELGVQLGLDRQGTECAVVAAAGVALVFSLNLWGEAFSGPNQTEDR